MTTPDTTQTSPTYRGTILVDTSALYHLSGKVAPHLKANGITPDTYLDMLRFLGQNGYRIIIPEMVAVEATNTLATGQDLSALFFKRPEDHVRRTVLPLVQDAALPPSSPHKTVPGMEIIVKSGASTADDLCEKLRRAVQSGPKSSEARNYVSRKDAMIDVRAQVVHLLRQYKTGFGDDAICALLNNKVHIGKAEKVLVLTSDIELVQTIRNKFPSIEAATAQEFTYGLGLSGAALFAGFSPDTNTEAMMHHQTMAAPHHLNNHCGPLSQTSRAIMQNSSFFKSLEQLVTDLAQQQANAAPAPEAVPGDRAARFAEKFSRFQRSSTALGK